METLVSETAADGSWPPEPASAPFDLDDPWAVNHPGRPTQLPQPKALTDRRRSRRRKVSAIATAVTLAGMVVTVVMLGDGKPGPTGGYAAKLGPAGANVSLQLPQQVGTQRYLMPDGSPMWQFYPGLLPSSPQTTYKTIAGDYFDASQQLGIDVDGVYALGNSHQRGIFTLTPSALLSLVAQQLFVTDFEPYPAGPRGGVLECGTYATQPLCVWADSSTLGFVSYAGGLSSNLTLAKEAEAFHTATEIG